MSVSLNLLLDVRKPDQGLIQVVEAAGLLLGIENTGESQSPEAPVYRTLQAGFASAGNIRGSPGLAPPWATSRNSAFASGGRSPADHHHTGSLEGGFGDGTRVVLPPGARAENGWSSSGSGSGSSSAAAGGAAARSETDEVVHALKLAVVGVTRRLMDETRLLPLQNRTTAVLVDGSRMSLLALELAGATWKFGRFVVVHVSGEKQPSETTHGYKYDDNGCGGGGGEGSSGRAEGPEHEDAPRARERERGGRSATAVDDEEGRGAYEDAHGGGDGGGERCGRWHPGFLEAELRETCLWQLEIPEESLELVFRSLPPGSSGTVDEVTKVIDATLAERGVEVVYMGCYGRRGPRVTHFGTVAHWALEQTPYQASCGCSKVSHMLDRLLPLVSPRDSVVLIHIVDESAEDVIAGEVVDIEHVKDDLLSLLSHKRGLSHRVRVETTGRPPEHPTQTVVQKIVKVAEEEAADFLAILYDESRGSYRTVATGCLRETRCGLIAIH
ncbi:unnamed protein product [Ectocarpus fasciculatus]